MTGPRRSRLLAVWVVGLAITALALVVLTPIPAAGPTFRAAGSGPVTATILFNGVNIDSHDSLSSAIATNFSGVFSTAFSWQSSTGGAVTVTQAEIQLLFFGTSIATSSGQFLEYGSNSYTLKSDFTQNQYIYEGTYEIRATLQDNGTTLLTQYFFIWIHAQNHLTVVNIVLIALIIVEIYEVAALGRVKLPKQPKNPPAEPAPSTPPADPSTPTDSDTSGSGGGS